MLKKIRILIFCIFPYLFLSIGYCQPDMFKERSIQSKDINEMNISVTLIPMKNSAYCYDFYTNSKAQLAYILYYLNKMEFIDDGKIIDGGDIPIVNINFIKKDGKVMKCGFAAGRFYDDTDKQYAIDSEEYNGFLDFIYALKTGKIILDDEITFEPSEWAKKDVDKAIAYELVPKFNQINYTGRISRLEVCQFIDNLLNKQNITQPDTTENPFSDTTDKSVINLYHQGIIHGKNENEFCPYDFITREETAKILSNTNDLIHQKAEIENGLHEYADQKEISDWAVDYINAMYALGIMVGNLHNEFKPQDNITKEEFITAMLRIT